jgi:hypothetical protein
MTKPTEQPIDEGWESKMADLINKEADECAGNSHQENCYADDILEVARKEIAKAYKEGLAAGTDQQEKVSRIVMEEKIAEAIERMREDFEKVIERYMIYKSPTKTVQESYATGWENCAAEIKKGIIALRDKHLKE